MKLQSFFSLPSRQRECTCRSPRRGVFSTHGGVESNTIDDLRGLPSVRRVRTRSDGAFAPPWCVTYRLISNMFFSDPKARALLSRDIFSTPAILLVGQRYGTRLGNPYSGSVRGLLRREGPGSSAPTGSASGVAASIQVSNETHDVFFRRSRCRQTRLLPPLARSRWIQIRECVAIQRRKHFGGYIHETVCRNDH